MTYVVLLVVLVALSAFFASAETAFLSLQRMRLAHMVAERVPGAARVQALVEHPRRLLSAILLGQNIANTATASVGTAAMARLVTDDGRAILFATLAVALGLVVFGEAGPKTLALSHAFTISRIFVWPMTIWVTVTRPAAGLLDLIARGALRIFGSGMNEADAALTAAELRTAIRLGAESGALEEEASEHLLGALTLQHRQVQEIMVPRVDMVTIDGAAPASEAARVLAEAGFLRLPVYEGAPDRIAGYLHLSDLNAAQVRGASGRRARDLMRTVPFESEHASIARVLDVMQAAASYMVMLVDEFGATSGLVTIEDIMEEVLGELRSESGFEEEETPVRAEGHNVVDGAMLLADLESDLDLDFEEIEANTVAGLVLALLRRFPAVGEFVDYHGYRFTVVSADERRITEVAIDRVPAEADA
ncbi:MAG: HlyC/CorC family transporter [Dehalococcoidia bacterium]|nr:MAG: HlyC/CorC family transporter [Dehalococcoidia bacterium]